jgi:alanine racemase
LFLALLTKVVYFSVATVEEVSALSNLVFKSRPFVLESNGHFPDLSVDHALTLTVHKGS